MANQILYDLLTYSVNFGPKYSITMVSSFPKIQEFRIFSSRYLEPGEDRKLQIFANIVRKKCLKSQEIMMEIIKNKFV